jgi:ribosomal protein L2
VGLKDGYAVVPGHNSWGVLLWLEYDRNRNTYICLIHYGDGEKRFLVGNHGISSSEFNFMFSK